MRVNGHWKSPAYYLTIVASVSTQIYYMHDARFHCFQLNAWAYSSVARPAFLLDSILSEKYNASR